MEKQEQEQGKNSVTTIAYIKGGGVQGVYQTLGEHVGVTIQQMAYFKNIEGVFDNYMQSDDWIENYHEKFKKELLKIDECVAILEMKGAETDRPQFLEFVKKEGTNWYDVMIKIEKVLTEFQFDFHYKQKHSIVTIPNH